MYKINKYSRNYYVNEVLLDFLFIKTTTANTIFLCVEMKYAVLKLIVKAYKFIILLQT